ncbi:MAG: hypothetical protein WC359_13640 [Dehalococcoidia bacterium]|jgi:transglutaminase-like putative cysteine protease
MPIQDANRITFEREAIPINDQPVSATFFGEGRWLTDFITPDALEVQALHEKLTKGITEVIERITSCWKWVADQVNYVKFVRGKVWIAGKVSVQDDLWTLPETTIKTRVGNCAVKSFLLTSLLRNELSEDEVACVLGNLYTGRPGGHAWVNVRFGGEEYTMESTTSLVPPLVPSCATDRYEAVHFFNDKKVKAVEGKTQLIPFADVYSTWLSDYLHWASIEGERR